MKTMSTPFGTCWRPRPTMVGLKDHQEVVAEVDSHIILVVLEEQAVQAHSEAPHR